VVGASVKSESGFVLFDLGATNVRLVAESDYPLLHRWRQDSSEIHPLSFQPGTHAAPDFAEQLNQLQRGNLLLLVEKKDNKEAVGYLMAYQVDLWNGWAHLGVYGSPEHPMRWYYIVRPLRCLLDFLFIRFPFLKVYVEIYDFADVLAKFLRARGWVEESYLPDHYRHGTNMAGVRRIALHREVWEKKRVLWSA